MTAKIIVGYKTRPVEGVERLMPVFTVDPTLSDPAKIETDLEAQRQRFLAAAPFQPYTATFAEVFLWDPRNDKNLFFRLDSDRRPISVRIRNYLIDAYPLAWEKRYGGKGKCNYFPYPQAIIIGFNPRLFLKILGLECSLPEINQPLPPGLWYGNSDHRDIVEAVCPKDFKYLDFKAVLARRRPVHHEQAARWDAVLKDWPGPGIYPEKDAQLVAELAEQLHLLRD